MNYLTWKFTPFHNTNSSREHSHTSMISNPKIQHITRTTGMPSILFQGKSWWNATGLHSRSRTTAKLGHCSQMTFHPQPRRHESLVCHAGLWEKNPWKEWKDRWIRLLEWINFLPAGVSLEHVVVRMFPKTTKPNCSCKGQQGHIEPTDGWTKEEYQ